MQLPSWLSYLNFMPNFSFYPLTVGVFVLISVAITKISFDSMAKISNIEIERIVDRDRIFMGDFLAVTIRVKNKSNTSIPYLLVSDVIPDTFRMALGDNYAYINLPPKAVKEFTYIVECPLRGSYLIGPTIIRIMDRAGLFELRKSLENYTEILVYPTYEDVKKMEILQRAYGGLIYGPHKVRQKGSGYDLWGIRRFVPGDQLKFIDWKTTAKYNRLMVKEFEAEKNIKLYVLLDASSSMGQGRETLTKLDFAARAAVLLGYLANRFQDDFGLLVFSNRVISFLEARKGKKHFLKFLEELAKVTPTGSSDLGQAVRYLVHRERRSGVLIIITDLEGSLSSYEEGIKIALAHKFYPIIISPVGIYFEDKPSDESEEGFYWSVVEAEYFLSRERTKFHVRKLGVDVIDVDPSVFIALALETYLRAKARNIGLI